ncbi:hypothetical protein OQA88_4104 [Cercophora sp. LCS_1]
MALANSIFFRKNYAMVGSVFAAGFAFEIFFNGRMDKVWDNYNRGRQWKDIRSRYVEAEEEE